jgi:hypothetical protein
MRGAEKSEQYARAVSMVNLAKPIEGRWVAGVIKMRKRD